MVRCSLEFIYADFESMFIPVEVNSNSKTKKVNKHLPSGWYTYSFLFMVMCQINEDILRSKLKQALRGPSGDKVKGLYDTFLQKPMAEPKHVLKREYI